MEYGSEYDYDYGEMTAGGPVIPDEAWVSTIGGTDYWVSTVGGTDYWISASS